MPLTHSQRTFLVAEVVGAALVNLLLNALIGWLAFRQTPRVSVWGDPGLVLDLSATALILPLLLCLITSSLVRRAVRAGKVLPLAVPAREHALLRWLPTQVVLRALLFGLLGLLLVAPALVLLMRALGTSQVGLFTFVAAKALLAAALAALAAPLAALYVLAQEAPVVTHAP